MYKNLFSQLNESQKEKSEEQEVAHLLSLRNDKTNADEAVIWITVTLYAITALVVYLGFQYYQKTFSEMFSPEIATLFAIILPAVVEIGKIKLVGKFFRAVSFGWIGRTKHWSQVAYWILVGFIGAGSFWWSYTISTGGIKEVAKENAKIKNQQQDFNTTLSAATADIDAQIRAIEQNTADAGPLKNKKGYTNWGAQPIHSSNAESLKSLYAQKEQITQVVTEEYKERAGDVKLKVSAWANFIERFGGWGEWAGLFCLIAICLFQRSLYEKNRDMVAEEEKKSASHLRTFSTAAATSNGSAIRNQHERHGAQFRWPNYGKNPSPTAILTPQPLFTDDEQKGVSHRSQSVTHQNAANAGNGADDAFKLTEKEIRGWAANFNSSKHKDSTVSANINSRLDDLLSKMHQEGFVPSRQTYLKFYVYVTDTLFPMLNEKGWPYERQTTFEQWLLHIGSATAQPA